MGDKEVKQWLKDARDLIKNKEYKTALRDRLSYPYSE
jgi:hypothetical protein